ncbi:N-acetylmuramoyl-L-alanine amidase [Abditibacterium utsteinense]|uniref:N-acetylmuramoyl-L-alanine amidase n=1 Tax=Abditibacterium utsteinense TaxID=1960156 RepID=A0A2S8SQL8_9BACT|nr:N-acetylmuramoyl-L-alanine amidase [Abditibacterium utsteinense]PQV63101.1 N-acetylmuramoyl-L-alanine amidase [Abditibacterium utsteinense]
MRRSFFRLRALLAVSLLCGSATSALSAPFVGGRVSADPQLTPLGGPIASFGQKSLAFAAQRPTFKSNAATKPPADGRPPVYPGVTYSDASEKPTVAGQPSDAIGPTPYDLGLIKRLQVASRSLPQAPLRVGNLDVLAPIVDQMALLGSTVTRADPRNVPGSLNVPGENQYFQINRPSGSPIVFTIGKSAAWIDSNEQQLRAAPLVIDNQIYLPIFSIAPLIGAAARLNESGTLVLTPTIQSVELFQVKDTVAVTIQASAPVMARDIKIVQVKGGPGSSPKVYIDFPGYSMGFDAGNSTIERLVAPGAGDVLRARAGMPSKFPDITRIVLDLKRPLSGMPQSVPDQTLFALVLAPQGEMAAVPDEVFDPQPSDPPIPRGPQVSLPTTGNTSLRGMTIVVDAGHGGHDTGARGRSSMEKSHTLDISRRLRNNLQARGANVLMTRDSDNFISLQGRVDFANQRRANLFVSVHINASPNKNSGGTETFYYTAISQSLAREVHKELVKATGRVNRNIHQRRFYVVRHTWMPSILTETAFISNSKEEALLLNPNYRERVARGIAQGISNYISIYGRPGLSG